MRWPPWRKKAEREELAAARAARVAAQKRLDEARRELIAPLRQMREENHIAPMLDMLIQRRYRGGEGGESRERA